MQRDEDKSREQLIDELGALRERLRQADARPTAEAADNAPVLIYFLDLAEQRTLYLNAASREVLGQPPEALEGLGRRYFEDLLHPADLPRYRAFATNLAATGEGEVTESEFRFRHGDGTWRWLHCREVVAARTADGRPLRLLGCALDVTAQRHLDERNHKAEKMATIGRLAGGLAHEFNNLLTVVVGYSELLLRGLADDDPRQQQVREIRSAGQVLAERTAQLLTFAQRAIIHPRVLDLNTFLLGTEKSLRHLTGPSVRVELRPEARSGLVWADPGQMYQTLLTLCLNACQAMPDGGRLIVETANAGHAEADSVQPPGPYVILAVTDTGCGMSPEVLAHLFEPFYTTRGVGQGTGLDLAAVYGAVKQCGGHVEVESQPGRGTTFRVYLPQAKELESERPAQEPTAPRGCWETLLVVSDELPIRQYTQTVLQQAGYPVLGAAGADEALEVCRRHTGSVHLLITDIELTNESGGDLAARLREARPEVRVLYMTGYGQDAVGLGLVPSGADLLPKPFSPLALIHRVRETLDQ